VRERKSHGKMAKVGIVQEKLLLGKIIVAILWVVLITDIIDTVD